MRNVDMRPRPDFVKAYMHNGYFKSLKAVVHFYNTRDTLNKGVHLSAGLPGEGIFYWPPPVYWFSVNWKKLGWQLMSGCCFGYV